LEPTYPENIRIYNNNKLVIVIKWHDNNEGKINNDGHFEKKSCLRWLHRFENLLIEKGFDHNAWLNEIQNNDKKCEKYKDDDDDDQNELLSYKHNKDQFQRKHFSQNAFRKIKTRYKKDNDKMELQNEECNISHTWCSFTYEENVSKSIYILDQNNIISFLLVYKNEDIINILDKNKERKIQLNLQFRKQCIPRYGITFEIHSIKINL